MAERQSLGPLLRKLYQRRNTEGYSFAPKFHEEEWAKGDAGGKKDDEDGSGEEGSVDSDERARRLVYNAFDICH